MPDFDALRKGVGLLPEQPPLSEQLKSTPDWTPDDHARNMSLGRELGVPADVVRDNRKSAEVDVQFKRLPEHQIKAEAPALFDRLRQDPNFQLVAKDDIQALYAAEKAAKALDGPSMWEAVRAGTAATVPVSKQMAGGALQRVGTAVRPDEAPIGPWDAFTKSYTVLSEMARAAAIGKDNMKAMRELGTEVAKEGAQETQLIAEHSGIRPGTPQMWVFSAIQSAPPMLAAAAGTVLTRSPAFGAAIMGSAVYGSAYAEGVNQMGLTPDQASTRAGLHAAAEGIPEMLPLSIAIKGGKLALGPVLKRYGLTTLGEGVQETITELLQMGIDAGMYGEEVTLKDAIVRVVDAGMAGLLMGGGLGAFTTATDLAAGRQHQKTQILLNQALDAENSAEALKALAEKVRNTKLFGRDREMAAEFIENAASTQTVHVDAKGVSEAYLRLGQADGDQMLRDLGIEDQVEQARMVGGDFVIPLRNVIKTIDSAYFEDVVQHLRKTPDSMTMKEAKEAQKRIKELQAEADKLTQEQTLADDIYAEAEAIRQDIERQLVRTGMAQKDAAANSQLHYNFALVMSKRTGLTPRQVMGPLTIERKTYGEEYALFDSEEIQIAKDLGIPIDRFDQAGMQTMGYTRERLQSLLTEYGYASGQVKASIARINPMDFVAATHPTPDEVAAEAGDLDAERMQAEGQTPFLEVEQAEDGTWKIVGHEGRHRLAAAAKAGVTDLPIVVVNRRSSWADRDPIPAGTKLSGQDFFGEGRGVDITLGDTVAIQRGLTPEVEAATAGDRLFQSASIRRGVEPIQKYGLQPGTRYTTRQIALALEARQVAKYGHIKPTDRSPEAISRVARWMVEEVKFELQNPEESGIGWYSEKWQRAIDTMGGIYPELLSDQQARNMFTLLMAITSDGQKVYQNFGLASELYSGFRATGRLDEGWKKGGDRNKSMVVNIKAINKLLETHGRTQALHDYLLQEWTVKDLREWGRVNKVEFKVDYLGDVKLPFSAALLGPKLGAFYANLMGSHGYLTMDRWWSRTFNRYRGELTEKPTSSGLARFRELLADAGIDTFELSNEDLLFATISYERSYREKGFKNGTDIEKAANTLYKAAFVNLRDAPDNAADRSFMIAAVKRAQQNLKRSGFDMTVADIQAALWYYEKRLYGELGARQSADISYEEAAARLVAGTLDQVGVNIEVAPNPKDLALTQRFNLLSAESKLQATTEVAEAVVRDVASKLGLPEVNITYTNGGYLDQVNPSLILTSPGLGFEDLRDLGLVLGEIFSQESIVVYDEAVEKGGLDHVRVSLPKELSPADQKKLYDHLRDNVGGLDGYTWRDGAMIFGDFSGRGDAFAKEIREALKTAPIEGRAGVATKKFRSELLETAHESVRGKATPGDQILRKRTGDPSASTAAYRERAAGILRGHIDQSFGQEVRRDPGSLDPNDLTMTMDANGQLRVDKDGMVPLTHWGRVKVGDVVDPQLQGTAADRTVQTAGRVARSYWGLPGYRAEGVVISSAKTRTFTRIAPNKLYDLARDPDGLRAAVKAENPGDGPALIDVKYEQAIKDAGYQGYWGQHPSGPIAALFEPVPVEEVHPLRTTYFERGRWLAGYDAQGNTLSDTVESYGQAAYHGTHVDEPFPAFGTQYIGSGEGHAAYGWGLYFAGARGVAEFYRRKEAGKRGTKGRLYHVELTPKEDEWLEWDKPMSEQSAKVKAALAKLEDQEYLQVEKGKGQDVYSRLKTLLGTQKDASIALHAAGVRGVKYLDADSRSYARTWQYVGDNAELRQALEDLNGQFATSAKHQAPDSITKLGFQLSPEMKAAAKQAYDRGELRMDDGTHNYVVFDEKDVAITRYEQSKLRGQIDFGQQSVIRLFEGANMSTFLHESGHFFLQRMRILSAHSPEIQADLDAVLKWMGIEHHTQIRTEHHEMFARGFEAYLREGKAPVPALRRVFSMFRDWLVSIYRDVRQLDVKLTDEVRGVMDRMLTADEAFAQVADEPAHGPLFKTPEDAAAVMTEAEYKDYVERVMLARDVSKAKLDKAVVEDEINRLSAEYRAEVREEHQRILEQLTGNRSYIARKFLETGKGIQGVKPFKLNREEIIATYGEEAFNSLPKGRKGITASDGISLDEAAALLGYDSGDALMQDQAKFGDMSREALAKARTIVQERKGFNPKKPEELQAAARDAIVNREKADVLFTELRALDRITGAKGIPRDVLKNAATRIVGEMKVTDLVPGRYLATSIRKAKEASAALAKKNYAAASKAKREQMMNHLLYMQVRDAKANLDAQRRFFKKFARPGVRKNIAGDYLDQIDNLLDAYDFKQSTEKERAKRRALAEFVADRMAAGEEVLVPPQAIEMAARVSYKDMSVDQLRQLQDWVKNLEHLGRLKGKLLSAKEAREFEATKTELITSLQENNKWSDVVADRNDSLIHRVRKGVSKLNAGLLNMEFVFMRLDGDRRGAMWENFWKPISDAQDQLALRKVDSAAAMKAINNKHGMHAWSWGKKVLVQEIGESLTLERRLAIALNWGNPHGRQRILDSGMAKDGGPWTEQQVQAILDSLSKNELQWVQDVWDLIDGFWPEIYQLQKDLTGIPPEKVEAVEVKTKHGTLRGGYYPLKYDTDLSEVAFKQTEKASVQEMFGGNWARAATRHGFTEKRVEKLDRAVRTDLGVIDQHISEVLLDITHRKAVMDVLKLQQDPELATAIKSTAGLEVFREINPWLQSVAQSHKPMQDATAWVKLMRHLRIGTSVVGLGFRLSTALINLTGIFPALTEIRNPGLLVKHATLFSAHPLKTWKFITERSPMMATRSKVFDREVSEQLRGMKPNLLPFWYSLIAKVDQVVTSTTWMAAYEQGMKRNNNNEQKAIDYADSVVRTTQSSGRVSDLAAVQRPSQEMLKMITVFYSYFNMIYNRTALAGRKAMKGKVVEATGDIIATWLLPALIGQLIAGRGPDDDEEWAEWAAKEVALYGTASVPVLRDVVAGSLGGFGYQFTPVAGAGENLVRTINVIMDEDKTWADARKPALNTAGYLFHLPTGQLNKSIDALENMNDFNLWHLFMGAPKE